MKLHLEPLVEFLDDPKKGDNRHASAIIGFLGEDLNAAAFAKYLEDGNTHTVTVVNESPRPGTMRGKRLDRWIYTKEHESGEEVLYQCEIKNWAASAIGGYRLPVASSDEDVRRVAMSYWADQLRNSFGGIVHPNGVTKVFMPMKPLEQYGGVSVEPLLIYWMPVLNPKDQSPRPFFQVSIKDLGLLDTFTRAPFDILSVFSVSLYFRDLFKKGARSIDLRLPGVERRIDVLSLVTDLSSNS